MRRERLLAEYRVLSEGGWFDACKCQALPGVGQSREPAPPFGSYVPLGLTIAGRRELMLGVDVGGTFTDVVCGARRRDHRDEGPQRCARPGRGRSWQGARRLGVEGHRGLQPREHDGPQRGDHADAAEGRLPDDRGPSRHARPRPRLAPARGPDRHRRGGARSATSRGRSCRATCAAASSSGCSPTAACYIPLDEAAGARASSRCSRAATSRASRSACSTPTSTTPTSCACASWSREVLGEHVAVSISSETSPLAKEYARASTTVIDVFMKLIFTGYAHELDAELRAAGFAGELNFADCAATLLPWGEALDEAVSDRLRRARRGHDLERAARRRDRRRQPDLLRRRRHLDRHLAGHRRPAVRQQHLRARARPVINALSTEISSVGAGGGSIVSISPSGDVLRRPGQRRRRPGPGLLRPRRDAADGDRRLPADGDPRSRRLRRRRDAPRPGACAARVRGARHEPAASRSAIAYAYRIAVANIAEEVTNVAIRHGADPRDFSLIAYGAAGPMLLPAALDALHVRRLIVPPHPGLFSALGLLSSATSSTTTAAAPT